MRTLAEEVKVLNLIAPVTQTSTTTGAGVDVEQYNDDAMAVVNVGAVTGGTPSVVVTIQGSLPGTPTTYNQTLATFTAITATGIAAGKVNLAGIKNVRAVATQTGAGNVPITAIIEASTFTNSASTNSL